MIDFENSLRQFFEAKQFIYPKKLFDAMEYAVFSGGKRVRPKLMMLSADFLGIERNRVLPLAIGLELIHSYSLIHDDLPCMDNDDFRRGQPTCHKKFGEDIALLAGDALLNLAYETLISAINEDVDLLPAVNYIAEKAGVEGMIGGQAMEFCLDSFDVDTVTKLYLKKTGALIKASLVAPCFLSFDRDKTYSLSVFADAVGFAFQLQDDILDEEKCEVKSYLYVAGKEKTLDMLKKLDKLAVNSLKKWEESKDLLNFSNKLFNRKI